MYVLLPAASQRAAGFEGVFSYFWSIVSLKDMKSLSPSLSFSPADILREGGIQLSQECFFNHSSRWTRTFIVRIRKAVWFLWKLFFCRVFKKGKQETSSYLTNQLPIFTLMMGWWFFFLCWFRSFLSHHCKIWSSRRPLWKKQPQRTSYLYIFKLQEEWILRDHVVYDHTPHLNS